MTPEERQETESSADSCTAADGDEADEDPGDARDHLRDVPVGSGCTEIWEHLAERREEDG